MTKKEEALEKIEKGNYSVDSPEGEIAEFLRAWLDYEPERAADLILREKKDVQGAFSAMREAARKKSGTSVCVPPAEAAELILEYFGCPDPKGTLEGGLMYAFMMANIERWAPYGKAAPKEMKHAASESTPKPKPAAEIKLDLESLLA